LNYKHKLRKKGTTQEFLSCSDEEEKEDANTIAPINYANDIIPDIQGFNMEGIGLETLMAMQHTGVEETRDISSRLRFDDIDIVLPNENLKTNQSHAKLEISENTAYGLALTEETLLSQLSAFLPDHKEIEIVELEDDVIELTTDNQSTVEGIQARDLAAQYTSIIAKRKDNKLLNKYLPNFEDIEINREIFTTLNDVDGTELGELFENYLFVPETEIISSESDSSSSSDDIGWFQIVPSRKLIEGVYNFDQRCRESMTNANMFLLTGLIQPDIEEILRSKTDLKLLVTLLSYIKSARVNLKLNKETKNLLKCVYQVLYNVMKTNNNCCYIFEDNMALKWKSGKLRFLAVKGFEDKDVALQLVASKPTISYEKLIQNCDTSISWLSTDLKQSDLDSVLTRGFDCEGFSRGTQICRILSTLIPRFKRTEFKLTGVYDF